MYRIGDKVQVRHYDEMLRQYGYGDDFCYYLDTPKARFVNAMGKYCGRVVTILEIVPYSDTEVTYKIEEDRKFYDWSDEMFEENINS